MREMKNSGVPWIGDIPKEWEMVYAKQLFTQRKERAYEGDEQLTSSQELGIIRQSEFMEKEGRQVVQVLKGEDILKHVESGDFVISMRSFQGGLEYSEVSGKISSAYVMLIPNHEYVYDRYYKWLFKSKGYITALQSTSNLIRDGQALRFSNFVQVFLPKLSLIEQRRIADYLDNICHKIDSVISKQRNIIEKLKAYKLSKVTEIVTKGIDPSIETIDCGISAIGKIASDAKTIKLKYLVRISDGTHDTPAYVDKGNSTFPLVTSKCIENGHVNTSLANHISKADYEMINKRSKVSKYDVIMPMIGTVGNPAFIDFEPEFAIKNVALIKTNGNEDLGKYVAFFLSSFCVLKQFEYLNRGGVQSFISQNQIKNLVFVEHANLHKIVKHLEDLAASVEKEISKRELFINQLQLYKSSLIYEISTGKREV